MPQPIVDAILNEGAWLSWSMALAFVLAAVSVRKHRHAPSVRLRVLSAMNTFYGCMIGTMALGHLLAVTIKSVQGILEPSLWTMYLLGLVLAIPGWWLAAVAYQSVDAGRFGATTLRLNAWLGLALLALGLPNLPLAAPAALNIGYQLHVRRVVGWTIASVAVAANVALFVGSLIFWMSGRTFEQFKGLE